MSTLQKVQCFPFNMNDGEMSNPNDDSYQTLSNVRQIPNAVVRNNIPDGGVGARVVRNSNDWKWGKQVRLSR